jgi:hypothetical protein
MLVILCRFVRPDRSTGSLASASDVPKPLDDQERDVGPLAVQLDGDPGKDGDPLRQF